MSLWSYRVAATANDVEGEQERYNEPRADEGAELGVVAHVRLEQPCGPNLVPIWPETRRKPGQNVAKDNR